VSQRALPASLSCGVIHWSEAASKQAEINKANRKSATLHAHELWQQPDKSLESRLRTPENSHIHLRSGVTGWKYWNKSAAG
jgi:hypothetical protein